MATVKITDLTDIGTPDPLDVLEIVDVSTNVSKKVKFSELSSGVQTVTGTTVDNADPLNPIVNVPTLQQVTTEGATTTIPIRIEDIAGAGVYFVIDGNVINQYDIATDDPLGSFSASQMQVFSGVTPVKEFLLGSYASGSSSHVLPDKLTGTYFLQNEALIETTSFTAQNDQPYTATSTLTVTDPTPVTGKGFQVHVIAGTSTIGGVGYTSGALVYRYYDGSVWVSTDMNKSQVADTITDGVTNIAPSQNAVFDAFVGVEKTKIFNNTQLPVTATVAETIISSVEIPANTFSATSDLFIDLTAEKNTAALNDLRIYINTTNTLVGATQIALSGMSNTRGISLIRKMIIRSGVLSFLSSPTTSIISNYGALATGVHASMSYTVGNSYFIICTVTNADITTITNFQTFKIRHLNY